MNRKYDRPKVGQVTRQWVKENCKNITDRDMKLLNLLYENKRKLLRRDQVQKLMYPEFISTDYLNKRLNILYKKHVIDKVYPPVGIGEGSSKQHICLDRAGIILLGLDRYNKPITTDKVGNRSLPLGWEHKVMLNEYECMIRDWERDGAEVLMYEVEEPNPYNDTNLIPDIMCLIKYKGKGYLFFIEVDLGTEDIPYVKRKINSYVDYYLSKMWIKKEWAKVFKTPVFPRVLFLTENGRTKRQKTLQQYTEESSVRFTFDFHNNFNRVLYGILEG